jgi:cytochrome c oxidase subunit 3
MSVQGAVIQPHADADEVGAHAQRRGMDTALLGMMLFIASEVMFFASLFGVYFNVKATSPSFPPEGTDFISWRGDLPGGIGISVLITIILVTSSFTMQWATNCIRKGDRTGMNRGIAVTLLLGVIFLMLQAFEYLIFVTEDDFGINSGVYGTLFYTMTGFHGAHVTGGVIGLAVILLRGMQGQFSAKHHVAVEAVHYYWHFVDIVWVALFGVLYVLR